MRATLRAQAIVEMQEQEEREMFGARKLWEW